jgi:integrase
VKFTDKFILNLKPKEKIYQVRENKGFGLRVLDTGRKIWVFAYKFDGRKRLMNLGTYPELSLADARTAHSKAYAVLNDKENPRDPQEQRDQKHEVERQERDDRRQHPTIKKLVEEYITKHAKPKKTSWKEDERILNKDVVPLWGDRKTEDVTRRDVLLLLDGMQGRGDGIKTNTFKIIRRMFRFAVKQEIISTTPCYAFEKGEELPIPVSKERNLSESEVRAFLASIDSCAISQNIRSILKLILLTGQRPGEVCSMHSSEIDGRWWEFTPKETKITKETPRKQRIYLTDTALELIGPLTVLDKKTKEMKPRGYIFKCHTDNTRCTTERSVAYALRRNLLTHEVKSKPATWNKVSKKTKISKKPFIVAEDKKLDIVKFTPHDLRRTCATLLSEMQFPDAVVDAVLAHLKKGEIRTYNKNKYDKEKQQALQAWERKLIAITTGKKSNIIPITAAQKVV